jgi:predicted ABC-type ATPase
LRCAGSDRFRWAEWLRKKQFNQVARVRGPRKPAGTRRNCQAHQAGPPSGAGVSAGREVLLRTAGYLRARESFAIETTLAGNWTNSAIRAALEQSFFTRLFYICLDNPERSIQRVRERAAQGGHDVPDADVRRRYARSLSNARHLLEIVHQALVFDNSGAEPRPVFVMRKGQLLNTTQEIPAWDRLC